MMTQSTQFEANPQPPTCADCPKFRDFQDRLNRGWCSVFNQVTRTHHLRTATCDGTIESQNQQQNRLTAMVELVTHELDIDPEEGFIFPKDSQIIEINVPELSRLAVEAVIGSHHEFNGYYIARFWEPQDAEF